MWANERTRPRFIDNILIQSQKLYGWQNGTRQHYVTTLLVSINLYIQKLWPLYTLENGFQSVCVCVAVCVWMHACACCVNKKVATLCPLTDPIYISVQLTLTCLICTRSYCFCFFLPTTGATFFMISNTTYLVHHTVGRPPSAIAS